MITNKMPQIAAPEGTHHSAAQLFLETITISESYSIVITVGSHIQGFLWVMHLHTSLFYGPGTDCWLSPFQASLCILIDLYI